jgi:hypothetical protein
MSREHDSKMIMKALSIQLPAKIFKRARGPGPIHCGPIPTLLVKGIRLCHNLSSALQRIRVVLSALTGNAAYQHVSLGREISIVFTAQGPLVYRCRSNHAGDSASADSPEANR